jgi:hypothetical protein
LLAHLKFCWRSFLGKVAPANNLRQQNFAGAAPENTDTDQKMGLIKNEVGMNRRSSTSALNQALLKLDKDELLAWIAGGRAMQESGHKDD